MTVIVMGVVGAGKTTVGRLLAGRLGWQFADADDFHAPEKIEKIRSGVPLDDDDRQPWLERLHTQIVSWKEQREHAVLACSALKEGYRRQLNIGAEIQFVYLKGSAALIARRLRARPRHFADEQILASQFADLEEPENAIVADIERSPEVIVAEIQSRLSLK